MVLSGRDPPSEPLPVAAGSGPLLHVLPVHQLSSTRFSMERGRGIQLHFANPRWLLIMWDSKPFEGIGL